MISEVLGPGCSDCGTWKPVVRKVPVELGTKAKIEKTKKSEMSDKFEDYPTLIDYGRSWVPRVV